MRSISGGANAATGALDKHFTNIVIHYIVK
jgi:hypothetical protein